MNDLNDQPRKIGLVWPMIIVACILGTVLIVGLLIGRTVEDRADRINTLALIFVGGITSSIVIASTSLPIRQWRRGEDKPETVREIRDGTQRIREIHYGTPAKYQLPDSVTADPMAFPGMVRAAYSAGITGGQQTSYAPAARPDYDMPPEAFDGDDVPPPVGWDGEIVM